MRPDVLHDRTRIVCEENRARDGRILDTIEIPTNVVRQYPAPGRPLHLEIGIVLFDKPIEKRLLRTVTPETNRSVAGILASQQLQHNRVLAMRCLPSLSNASQSELSSNPVYDALKFAHLPASCAHRRIDHYGLITGQTGVVKPPECD